MIEWPRDLQGKCRQEALAAEQARRRSDQPDEESSKQSHWSEEALLSREQAHLSILTVLLAAGHGPWEAPQQQGNGGGFTALS